MSAEQLQAKISQFAAFLQADPDNPALLLELGQLYHQAGHFDDALAYLVRLIELDPGSVAAQSRIAAVYLSQHRFAEAGVLLQRLADGGDRSTALQHNLGIALFFQERYAEAAACFSAARDAGLDAPANAKFLAYALHHEGDLEGAALAADAWSAGAATGAAKAYLSLISFDLGQRDKARSLAQAVLAEEPDSVDAHTVLGSLALEEQDIDSAAASFGQVLARQPDDGRALLGLGLTQLHAARPQEAIVSMQHASASMPGHAGTLVALGWAQLTAGDAAAAEKTFPQAIEIDRNFAESHGGLAAALVHLQRPDQAKTEIMVANKLDRANFGAVYAQAMLLKQDNRSDLADRLIGRALQQAPVAGGPTIFEGLTRLMGNARR